MIEEDSFSRKAWMVFVAHLAVAFVVIAPIAYGAAQYVAQNEAAKAVDEATYEMQKAVNIHRAKQETEMGLIRIKQAELTVDIKNIKEQLERLEKTSDRINHKLDRLIEKQLQ